MVDETLIYNNIKVEWVELGEGWNGDYDEDDPDDVELLRFDVWLKNEDGEWYDPGDASYCTQVPVSTTYEQRMALLKIIAEEAYDAQGFSLKKCLERMSWISLDWLPKELKQQSE